MKKVFYSLIVLLLVYACDAPIEKNTNNSDPLIVTEEQNDHSPDVSDTVLVYEMSGFTSEVLIKTPKQPYRGTILALQGWNFPNTSWSDSSDLEKLASEMGFILVMPSMGKSIYQKRNYPETRKDWQKYPTRTWLMDTLIQELQNEFNLFFEGAPNFVMGLSTGGRGAFIVAQENPKVFRSGASLSGDYDQSAFPEDNLYRGYFGTNPGNWSDDENPVSSASQWSVPMYVAHGAADKIVPVRHAIRLQEVKEANGGLEEGWVFRIDEVLDTTIVSGLQKWLPFSSISKVFWIRNTSFLITATVRPSHRQGF